MKNILTSIIILSLIGSCGINNKSESVYTNDKMNISFNYPKNWEVRTDSINNILYILSPYQEGDEFQEMMNVVVGGTHGLNLDDFLSVNLASVEDVFDELNLTEEPTNVTINNRLFKKVSYNYVSEGGGYPLTAGLYVTLANEKSYIINCSALQNTYDQYRTQFMEVINSIEIE